MSLPANILHNYGAVRRPVLVDTNSGAMEDLNFIQATQISAAKVATPNVLLTGIKVAAAATDAGALAAGVAVGEMYRGPNADPQILYIRRV